MHARALAISRLLLGPDMTFDFDTVVSKEAYTATPTAWHQDQAYLPEIPDNRSVICWTALSQATVDNGCLWLGTRSLIVVLLP